MKPLASALSLVLLGAVVVAQTEVRTATVEGAVKNVKTGEPIPDVRVTLTPDPAAAPATVRNANTDAEGRFSIATVPPGRYSIVATRTLFFRPRRDAGAAVLTVVEGQRLNGVQILLAPTGVIAGRILDDKREPLRSIRVDAMRREYRDGVRAWVQAAQATTDDRGEYRLFNLNPGSYYIRATQSTTTLYYPGLADSQSAVPVAIEAGSEVGAIDIEMRRSPEYAVQLKLGGFPAGSMANFQLRRRNGLVNDLQSSRSESLPDNTYRLVQLAPGTYDLLVQVYSPPPAQPRLLTHSTMIPIAISNSDLDLGTVSLRPTTAVTGRIVVPDPLPSPLIPGRLVVTLRAMDLPTPMTFFARGSTNPPGVLEDGSFTVGNVATGRYQLTVTGLPNDTFVIAAREGTRDVLDAGYSVDGSQNPVELTIGGPGSMGNITGTVINALGQPLPSATVVLVPSPDRRSNPAAFRTTIADQLGNFSIRSVLAGDYRVIAWEEIEPGIYLDPEFLRNFETRGESLRVQRGSQSAVTVRVIPAQ